MSLVDLSLGSETAFSHTEPVNIGQSHSQPVLPNNSLLSELGMKESGKSLVSVEI